MTRKVTDLSVDELVALLAAHVRLISQPGVAVVGAAEHQRHIVRELKLAMMAAKVKGE